MLRRISVLLAVPAVLVVIAVAPVSAAKPLYVCPKGSTVVAYCKRICVLPFVKNKTVGQALAAYKANGCRVRRVVHMRYRKFWPFPFEVLPGHVIGELPHFGSTTTGAVTLVVNGFPPRKRGT